MQTAITIHSPLPCACLSSGVAAIGVSFGVSPVLDTIETQAFEVFSGSLRSLLVEADDVDLGSVAVWIVACDILIPVPLEFRQCS